MVANSKIIGKDDERKTVEGLILLMENCIKKKGEECKRGEDRFEERVRIFFRFIKYYEIAEKLDYFPKEKLEDLKKRYENTGEQT